jgi:uncharacterized protein YdaU (DUF1376 family)
MAKDPAFLFYPGDFMQGTQTFTREEKGAYLDLLILQFNEGHMSLDLVRRCLNGDFERLWPFLQKKFDTDKEGFFFNKRLDDEKFKRIAYSESRRKNKSYDKSYDESCDSHMTSHMENENENRNKDINGIKEGVQGKPQTQKAIHDLVFAEPNFIRNLKDSHPGKDYERAWSECYAYHSNRPNPPNQLWVWRQKVLTWLSNMKPEAAHTKPTKKKSYQEFIKKAS